MRWRDCCLLSSGRPVRSDGFGVWAALSLSRGADRAFAILEVVQRDGNYMRKCASGGQSLANAERGVVMSGFAGKIGD